MWEWICDLKLVNVNLTNYLPRNFAKSFAKLTSSNLGQKCSNTSIPLKSLKSFQQKKKQNWPDTHRLPAIGCFFNPINQHQGKQPTWRSRLQSVRSIDCSSVQVRLASPKIGGSGSRESKNHSCKYESCSSDSTFQLDERINIKLPSQRSIVTREGKKAWQSQRLSSDGGKQNLLFKQCRRKSCLLRKLLILALFFFIRDSGAEVRFGVV